MYFFNLIEYYALFFACFYMGLLWNDSLSSSWIVYAIVFGILSYKLMHDIRKEGARKVLLEMRTFVNSSAFKAQIFGEVSDTLEKAATKDESLRIGDTVQSEGKDKQ
jgi:predicted membrane protein